MGELKAVEYTDYWAIEDSEMSRLGEGATEIEAWKDAAMSVYKKRNRLMERISEVMEMASDD